MRVLHVVTAWPRDPDDVITPWLVTLTEKQSDRDGYAVHVLAPSYRGLPGNPKDRVKVHRYRYAPRRIETLTHEEATPDRLQRQPWLATLVPGYVGAGMLAARSLARRIRFDAIHVHWAVPHGPIGWAGARAVGANLVTTFYGAEIRWAETRFPPARRFLRWYCRRTALVAISNSTRELLRPYAAGPVAVIPYGVPLPGEPPDDADDRGNEPTLLFVGRLVARKGVDRMLEALARVTNRPWRFEIVGFGPEGERLQARAAELGIASRVDFLGRVPQAELEAAYRRATLFVLPATLDDRADTEGLGVVLLEAMAYGVPVVATRRGGITDIVVDGETGLLVEDTIDALERGVVTLLDHPERARELGDRGRARVTSVFSWETIVDRLDAVYRSGSASGE